MRSLIPIAGAVVFLFAGCGGGGADNLGILSFTSLSYSVNENGTPLNVITLQRLGGDGAVGATVIVEPETATASFDYLGDPIVVTWAAGDLSQKIIAIPIFEDHDDEPEETLKLRLVNPTGGAEIRDPLGDTTLHIVDNDVAGILQFGINSYAYFEDGMVFGPEIMVTRSGGADGEVSATVIMTDGTASGDPMSPVEPFDFTSIPVTVTFADQNTTPVVVSLAGVIRQDLLPEPGEAFNVELIDPTGGAMIGLTSPASVNIIDDDLVLTIPNPQPGTLFGVSVAKLGSKLLIGAPGNAAPEGRAYVFDPSDGSLVDTIARPGSNQLGSMLAVGASTLAIGAPGTVWGLDPATLLDRFVLTSSLGGFGQAAAVLGDDRLVVGAPQAPPPGGGVTPAGAVLAYDALTGAPLQTIDGAGDLQLGASFALFGSDVLAGAPGGAGAVFEYGGNPLAVTTTFDDPAPQSPSAAFGRAIVASDLDSAVFVGAPDADVSGQVDAGRVDLFAPSGNATASQGIAGARFGANLMISGDFVYIQSANDGPSGAGRVWVYDKFLGSIFPIDSPNPMPASGFGNALCDFDGSIVIAAPNQPGGGTVFIVKLF
jgi:Calx-beta domain